MRLKPLKDKIVVKPTERVKSSVIEVVMTEQPNMGSVLAVGKDAEKYVQVGDYIRFGTMGNDEYLKYPEYIEDGEKYLILSWRDVCFIEDKP
jgi:co-chaperonin GroES (HSP10)